MPFDGNPNIHTDSAVTKRLIEGRANIENGWCQNALADDKGRVCILGAILRGDMIEPLYRKARLYLLYSLPNQLLPGGVSAWNDNRQRTQEEVLAMFDKAIEASRLCGGT